MKKRLSNSSGTTIIELLFTMGMLGVFMVTSIANIDLLERPLENSVNHLQGYFKQTRAKAISTTSAYLIEPVDAKSISARVGDSCTAAEAATDYDPRLQLEFPTGVLMTDTSWSVCFTGRGLPDANVIVDLLSTEGNYKTVELLLGGAVRVYGS